VAYGKEMNDEKEENVSYLKKKYNFYKCWWVSMFS
jgi:hypothetical protein